MSSLEVEGWHEEHLADSTDLLPENNKNKNHSFNIHKSYVQCTYTNVHVWIIDMYFYKDIDLA